MQTLAADVEILEGKGDLKECVLGSFSCEEWCYIHIYPEDTQLYKELWMWSPERLVNVAECI